MDANVFDSFARSLSLDRSRRQALAAALGGTLGLVGLMTPDDAEAARGCANPCGECGFCKKGKCTRKNGTKKCERGKCLERVEGTPCTGGFCLVGQCAPPPPPPPPPLPA